MSALAKLMLMMGKEVSGSDLVYNEEMCILNQWGAEIWVGHDPDKAEKAELIVYSLAVPSTDPELVRARERGIACVSRPHFLSEVTKDYAVIVAVAGTHGKTTATSIIANIFNEAGKAFSAHIGGNANGLGNMVYKGYDYFITEACEYKKSFIGLVADVAVVLNAEIDHPDTYSTVDALYDAFDEFLQNIKKGGAAVVSGESEYFRRLNSGNAKVISYGLEGDLTYLIENIREQKNGFYSFQITQNGMLKADISLKVPGYHNIYNATAAYAVCEQLKLDRTDIIKGIESFAGVERRFEEKGKIKGARIFVDYAHHPSEIRAAIATALSMRPKRLLIVFQPHTYSRTKRLFDEFTTCLSGGTELYLFKEYAARELPLQGASAYNLYTAIRNTGVNAYYYGNLLPLAEAVASSVRDGDIVLILGAGDIVMLADILKEIH